MTKPDQIDFTSTCAAFARRALVAAAFSATAILSSTTFSSADTQLRTVVPSVAQKADKLKKKVAARKNPYLGRAPYICTPSGFGKTATCFLRSNLKQG